MPQNRQQTGGSLAQQMFGPQAGVYAESKVHISDDSLESVQKLASLGSAKSAAPCRWAVDVGAGAGFTAFAMTDVSERVVATDITRPMLQQAGRISGERGLDNVMLAQHAAESLPFANGSLDLITCRKAGHHFRSFAAFLDETARTLRPGGVLVMADTVAPEDDALTEWMNSIELRRDFSHVQDRKISVIRRMLADRGFEVAGWEDERVYLWFNAWVSRTRVPDEEAKALRSEFQEAAPDIVEAFRIGKPEPDGDFLFSFPVWVFRAVKK